MTASRVPAGKGKETVAGWAKAVSAGLNSYTEVTARDGRSAADCTMLTFVASRRAPAGMRKAGPPGNDTTPPCGATVTLSGSGGGSPNCQTQPNSAQIPASAGARDM